MRMDLDSMLHILIFKKKRKKEKKDIYIVSD